MGQKIKLKISYLTYSILISDMDAFQFHKKDGTINKNLFLNTLIYNYYSIINEQNNEYNTEARKSLEEIGIKSKNINKIIDLFNSLNTKTENSDRLDYEMTFLVTSKFESAFEDIELNYLSKSNLSEYLRKLLNSYVRLSRDKREKILFKDRVKIIETALKSNKKLLVEINGKKKLINPIGIYTTKENQYSYLVYYEKFIPIPIHLFKCKTIALSKELKDEYEGDDEILKIYLKGDFVFVDESYEDVQIKLTKKGLKLYRSIYVNRPVPFKIEGDIYHFNVSNDQLFFYFSRFGGEATVLNNYYLSIRLYRFYKEGYDVYDKVIKKHKKEGII